MPDLIPTFPVSPLPEQQTQASSPRYGRSWAWNWETGDFAIDGAGRVQTVDGYQAWVDWCLKTVQTERSAYLVYSAAYGAELEDARKHGSREAVESALARAITEALLADPRTAAVRGFSFVWHGDELHLSCTVVPTIGDPARLEVTIGG